MKILAVGRLKEGIDARSAIAPYAREELKALWQLYETGIVREVYSPGGPGAVLVLEADSTDAARAVLSVLPLVAEEIIQFELIELLAFTAFDALFAAAEQA